MYNWLPPSLNTKGPSEEEAEDSQTNKWGYPTHGGVLGAQFNNVIVPPAPLSWADITMV